MRTFQANFIAAAAALIGLALTSAPALAERPRQFETQHYRIWTDVDYELSLDLGRRMDAMYEEYARRFATFAQHVPQGEKLDVRIFEQRKDYVRYTEDRLPNTGGIFIPGRKLLAVYLEGQTRDGLRRTLQHEAFHQFAHSAIGPNLPVWLNEGIAQVFEEGIWTGQRFLIGQVPPRRIRQLQQDMRDRRLLDFRGVLAMDEKGWQRGLGDRADATVQYNQTWAMAHFLIYATGGEPDAKGNGAAAAAEPLYRGRLIEMLRRSQRGVAPQEAFEQAFSGNVAGFQQRFVDYARKLEPTLEATHIENQGVLADLLIALRQREKHFDSVEAFRNELVSGGYRLQYTKGAMRWSTAEDMNTYFTDQHGRLMNERQMYFERRRGAPMPDLVCRALDGITLRTRFHGNRNNVEYEVLVEPRSR